MVELIPVVARLVAIVTPVLAVFGWLVRLEQRVNTIEKKKEPVTTVQCGAIREDCLRLHEQRFAMDEQVSREIKQTLACLKKTQADQFETFRRDQSKQHKDLLDHIIELSKRG